MNAISEAIKNLETSTQALDKFVNNPEHYNSVYSTYLEVISWEMHKHANELKQIQDQYGMQ